MILIDGARHYQSMNYLRKVVDALAIAKFNVLHFHATDDESFQIKTNKEP